MALRRFNLIKSLLPQTPSKRRATRAARRELHFNPKNLIFETALTKCLEISHPIILAPMNNISGGDLAGEVARAGALGLIGAASSRYSSPEWIRNEYQKAQARFRLAKEYDARIQGSLGFGFLLNFMPLKELDPCFIQVWLPFL